MTRHNENGSNYATMLGMQAVYLALVKTYLLLALRSIHLNELDKIKEIDAALAASYDQVEMTDFNKISLEDYTMEEEIEFGSGSN